MNEKTAERIAKNWERIDRMEKSESAQIPRLLMLEVTNACNLRCKMCGNPKMTRSKGFMPLEMGKRAIREAAETGIGEIALFTTGEPLLYPRLEQLLVEAKKHDLYCFMTSNGLLLNENTIEMLCGSGLDSFKFSIDGTNEEEYESIRRQGNFDTLLKNTRLLRAARDRLNSGLKIICAMVLMEENRNHLTEFERLFEPVADDILISRATNLGGKYEKRNKSEKVYKPAAAVQPCRLLWDRIIINYDGKITACCVDFDAELVYGDYNSETLAEAWNNETIRGWRKKHLTGRVETMPLCDVCDAPYIFNADDLINVQEEI